MNRQLLAFGALAAVLVAAVPVATQTFPTDDPADSALPTQFVGNVTRQARPIILRWCPVIFKSLISDSRIICYNTFGLYLMKKLYCSGIVFPD